MTSYDTISADGHHAAWAMTSEPETAGSATDESSSSGTDWSEHVELRWDNEAWTATGELGHEQATYVVRLSPLFETRQLLLFRDLDEPDLWLGTDGRGRWGEVNGAHRPDLDGASDVRVGDSIFSFGSIIRRLALPVGGSETVSLAQVDPETLGVVVTRRTFSRLDSHRWRVETDGDELGIGTIEFDVDAYGLPIEVVGISRRM